MQKYHSLMTTRQQPTLPVGDTDLDFDRDTLFAHLAALGIQIIDREAYVCP